MQPESRISRRIRVAVVRSGRARIFPNRIVPMAYAKTRDGRMVPVGWLGGPEGSPDLWGALRGGRAFCLEVKTPTGTVSPTQRRWHAAARAWGVFVAVVRSPEEALEALARAERGECE